MHLFERILSISLIWLFLGVSCVACVTQVKRVLIMPPGSETPDQYHGSIARLYLQPGPKGNFPYQATAFAISDDYMLTAGHYCNRLQEQAKLGLVSKKIKVEGADRNGELYFVGTAIIVANHKKHDMCIIKSENHGLIPLKLFGDMSIIETEDKVTTIGAPRGFFPVRREGHIISKKYGFCKLILIALNVDPGSSGSPVIWNGRVIGIVVRHFHPIIFKDGALATRGDHIVKFVEKTIGPLK